MTFFSWLVVTGTMEWIMTFHSVGNFIIPNSYFSEGLKPPTSHHEGLTFTMKSWGFTGLAHLEEGLSSKSRRVEVTPV